MDPNECLRIILEGLVMLNREWNNEEESEPIRSNVITGLNSLALWLSTGGFAPDPREVGDPYA